MTTLPEYGFASGRNKLNAKNLSWQTTLVAPGEPGEPMVVSGVLYTSDGKTPIPGAILYVYHTDASGLYNPKGSAQEAARIRGWMKTDARGRFEFRSIKPASYPNSNGAAHIHAQITLPDATDRWTEFFFDDDPHVERSAREKHKGEGLFSPVMKGKKDKDGAWHYTRNIRVQ